MEFELFVTSHRATPVVVEDLKKVQPLESLHLHRYFNRIT